MKKQCSKLFDEIFDSNCGGPVHTCDCRITYFDTYNDNDWEEGELEKLRQQAEKEPDLYVEHNCAIGTMEINGIEIVYGCTCNTAERYERFIINHAKQLAEYLNKWAVILREKADAIEIKKDSEINAKSHLANAKLIVAAPRLEVLLMDLLEWAKGNRGSKHINPYSVPEVKAALECLAELQGINDYLDAKTK